MWRRHLDEDGYKLSPAKSKETGTAGEGTSIHLAGVMFAQMTGLNTIHVPYRGSVSGITESPTRYVQ
ncbi:tripartite tricarboxylate transporter substrate-binding protein [Comamonas thiooxydans]|uniref:Tripartite tricarboxylate transporter substrate-binding protein n=1 Tax=Comamonas thiooxydans TaxID=363952 RepID=A0AA42Q450_9BURK|nr:tripartite tricarboxylate transporter substrate-binding protein [Comamonas thiooxydans]MDH1336669.1 tripartite tricarboxylate transporter substrate-binding protein [Comamonas thiooxydans]MDH1742717.1 tripartite tricarboxylate transporter substrate-binding protein [Comamonas thiooxydans]MDH1789136.1 tripartite tricarboxylate transporter substrate-binding protein [Comamonas thiooxydans]